jgi:hypothetical protein
MTAAVDGGSRRRALFARLHLAGAATAALALVALIAIGPATKAATVTDGYNQMTGIGNTASAITVNWTSGLLNAENQPITAAGSELSPNSDRQSATPTSKLAFMYPDFKNLQFTVSQTNNISHQGITITWTGGLPTQKTVGPMSDFMQMMECWGDADTGPNPENCEYGSANMLPASAPNFAVGNRYGYLCNQGDVPSTTTPPPGFAFDPAYGCDTSEPTTETVPGHCDPNPAAGNGCGNGLYDVPFVAVDDPTPIYQQTKLVQDFNEFNSNEVQEADTSSNKTGQLQFETLTNVEAPHLGCGALETDGKPRGCWLVIVPRGSFEPNGYQVSGFAAPGGYLETSPLAASNWAQRVQIHLNYAPLGTACPPTVLPDQVVGTQVITRAVGSWELALNQAANCNTVYAFTATTETAATAAMRSVSPGNGNMAFTTIPIGSESTRYTSGKPPSMPNLLYAPVAVTAMGFGFNINEGTGYVTTQVKLTPQLLARALTQVYDTELPDFVSGGATYTGPLWAEKNPLNITLDPAFTAANPASIIVPYTLSTISLAPLLTEDHSQLNQQVWQWVQTDPATAAWLDTASKATDPVQADPDYVKLALGKAPAQDSFPRAYSGVFDGGICGPPDCPTAKEEKLVSIDMLPYASDIGTAASLVLAANNTALVNRWSILNIGPDGTPGWWSKVGAEPAGQAFMWALSDMPDVASYGLIAAQLCSAVGAACVGPTIDSVTKTLNATTADSAGLLEVNPAKVPAGGYPLVQVVYAAVPTNQSAQSLTDYANLIKYAANQGQNTGSNPGNLPPGYLPLTAKLKAQANAVVKKLQQLAGPTPTPTPTTTTPAPATTTPTPTPTPTTTFPTQTPTPTPTPTTTTTTPAGGVPTTSISAPATSPAAPSTSPTTQSVVIVPPESAQLASGTTQATLVSNIRLVLVLVLIIGAAGSTTGVVLRSDWRPRRRHRRGPS